MLLVQIKKRKIIEKKNNLSKCNYKQLDWRISVRRN